jgi:acetyl-CoA carboxylase carboxyltransferase component
MKRTDKHAREINAAMRAALKAVIDAFNDPMFSRSKLSLAMSLVREAYAKGRKR